MYRPHTDQILTVYWLHIDHIPTTFTDHILTVQLVHYYHNFHIVVQGAVLELELLQEFSCPNLAAVWLLLAGTRTVLLTSPTNAKRPGMMLGYVPLFHKSPSWEAKCWVFHMWQSRSPAWEPKCWVSCMGAKMVSISHMWQSFLQAWEPKCHSHVWQIPPHGSQIVESPTTFDKVSCMEANRLSLLHCRALNCDQLRLQMQPTYM